MHKMEKTPGWPVFEEGMALLPAHFQQLVRSADVSAFCPTGLLDGGGFLSLKLDDRLAQGQLGISRCVAILADGSSVVVPDRDTCRPVENLDQRLHPGESATVWLTAGARDAAAFAVGEDEPPSRVGRFRRQALSVADDYLVERERDTISVLLRDVALRVTRESESLPPGLVKLPVAHLERRAEDGRLQLSARYAPPSLAMEPLLEAEHLRTCRAMLEGLVQRIRNNAIALGADLLQQFGKPAAVDYAYLRKLLRLQLLTSGQAVLAHCLQHRSTHPASLHLELVRLIDSLRVFEQGTSDSCPSYVHSELWRGLDQLCHTLDQLLDRRVEEDFELVDPEVIKLDEPGRLLRFRVKRSDILKSTRGRLFLVFRGTTSHADKEQYLNKAGHLKVAAWDQTRELQRQGKQDVPHLVRDPPANLHTRSWFDREAAYVEIATLARTSNTARLPWAWSDAMKEAWKTVESTGRLEVFLAVDKAHRDEELRLVRMIATYE